MQNSAIGRAVLRFYAGGRILIEDGGGVEIRDSGFILIDGDLTGAGDFDWTGTLKQTGPSTFEGPTVFTGTINATGNTAWAGTMSIVGDIVVLPGGKILAGNMLIDPTTNGGSIKFAGGPEVYASGSKLSLYSGLGAFIELDGGMAKINGPGARWLEVNSSGFRMVNLPSKTSASVGGLPAGVVHADSSGNLFRITS
ncbi:hypothetical protein [Microbacterium sp. K41]|uniref:hypothetical protein n=1 Tax=Microbacterium sp. K41 TaxID=2305437 RepID=UPI00109CD90F|nr:hypothetical protein [Microbacterium sp. K41]